MRLVLVRLSALGDIVHTWPLAVALRAALPDCHLTWVVEAPFVPLVEGHPAIDRVVPVRTRSWRHHPFSRPTRAAVTAVRSALSSPRPDLCLDAQGLVKSATVCRWSRAPRRIGLARPWRRELLAGLAYSATVPGSRHPHVVATNLALLAAVGVEPPAAPVAPDGRWLLAKVAHRRPTGPWPAAPAVLLPGAGKAAKILPAAAWSEVASELVAAGHEVVVAWGPGEEERARAVVHGAGGGVHLAPATDLEELAALLGAAAVVVGGDTGPVHLAASLGVPTVAVFLASNADRNGPLGSRTAVVSGAAPSRRGPSGSATATPLRNVSSAEIAAAVATLVAGVD